MTHALFRSLFAADLVDTVEVGVSSTLLGQGRPLPSPGRTQKLKLTHEQAFPSGLPVVYYDVVR